ncbi:MAG TPA: hypothetical protein VNX21_03740, partial [Candidatus Thermoplasmatota archaeon]|nr:hypothetical protein [Candidatus Thermoplasmatota archaeon]
MLLRDDRPRKGHGGLQYRQAWSFKDDAEDEIRRQLETCPRPVVHLCSGASRVGDVHADIHHPGADVRADARRPPFRGVGTVVMDPPWKMPVDARWEFVRGALSAIRPGGVLLLYAPWMPQISRSCELEG